MLSNDPLYSTIRIPENKDFQVKYFIRKNPEYWHIKNHYHDIYEIVLYEEIHGSVYLNGEKEGINRNKLLYLPPYTVHGFELEPDKNVYTVLHLSPQFLSSRDASFSLPAYAGLFQIESSDYEMINRLLLWGREKRLSHGMRQQFIFTVLLWITEQNPYSPSLKREPGAFTRLLKTIDLQKNYGISLMEAATLCNMSRSSFCEHFRKQFGTSFNRFLREKKIDEAQHLLLNTVKSCTEIATELEFSDASHFSKLFKQQTGFLPGDFRKNAGTAQ